MSKFELLFYMFLICLPIIILATLPTGGRGGKKRE